MFKDPTPPVFCLGWEHADKSKASSEWCFSCGISPRQHLSFFFLMLHFLIACSRLLTEYWNGLEVHVCVWMCVYVPCGAILTNVTFIWPFFLLTLSILLWSYRDDWIPLFTDTQVQSLKCLQTFSPLKSLICIHIWALKEQREDITFFVLFWCLEDMTIMQCTICPCACLCEIHMWSNDVESAEGFWCCCNVASSRLISGQCGWSGIFLI